MGRLGTIARRTFLIGSAAIVGGVAFGVYKVRQDPKNPLADQLAPGAATFNPWVLIDATKVVLVAPHTDMGQGARSMQAALIAEELDIDFGQFEISPGAPDAAYWNTALGADAVPFMSTDEGAMANSVRSVASAAFKLLGAQLTGGSSSVPDSFDKLRMAGAVARETLKLAASQKTGISVDLLTTGHGAVIFPRGEEIPYTELAGLAAGLEPVTDVELRAPSEWRLIGKPMMREDIVAKSTGTLTYGIDLSTDRMLHATVRMNPRKGGTMTGLDRAEAQGMRGVVSVLELDGGYAVVADNTWRAFRAADAVRAEWGPAPYPAEQADHWAEVAASFTEARLDKVWRDDGDVAAALSAAEVIETEYRVPYAAHQPLEPLSAMILVGPERTDIWVSSQVPRFAVDRVAGITGQDSEQIHLHNQYAGGSFGHRLEFSQIDAAARIGAANPGTPVKVTFSREEDFTQDFPRQIGMARARGAVKDGRVVALDLQIATTSASRSQSGRLGLPLPGPDMQIVAGAWNQPFAVPHLRVTGYAVPGLSPTSSWRSVGAVSAGFFAECALDELIRAAGADPMEERLRLVTDPLARKVLEAVAEMSIWGTDPGPGRGRGVALVTSFGVPVAEVVEVTQTDAGLRIDHVHVAAEVGRIVDPVNFENHVQGAVVWGLGHAINCELTYADGMVEQTNFHAHEGMRIHQCPQIHVRGLENGSHVRGIGEPPVPPAAPALANAIFDATGVRLRAMPFNAHMEFV